MTTEDFSDIAPYEDGKAFSEGIERLLAEPRFENAIRYVQPDMDFDQLKALLRQFKSKDQFQQAVMRQILLLLEAKTSKGVTASGFDNYDPSRGALLMSNHRDIVLDAGFLGLCMLRHDMPAMEVALGDNLLIYPWIEALVRLNKGVIVKRNLRLTKALEAAKQLSAYIHYTIDQRHSSLWLAQREGRAKDSNDRTQESVIKMLALAGQGECFAQRIIDLHITPVSISYEYDPNDYLKAREFLARRRDPEFHKSQRDDLFSMETGLLQQKGRIHFAICRPLTPEIEKLLPCTDKVEAARRVCALIDREIHLGYTIYPVNYYAYDTVNDTTRFADRYTPAEAKDFEERIASQLDKVDLPDITAEEREFMRDAILRMYANPLANQLSARQGADETPAAATTQSTAPATAPAL